MELYAVEIDYRDVYACKKWQEALKRDREAKPPERKRWTAHVAVSPSWGGDCLKRAGDLAVRSVVGNPDCWEEYQPMVQSIRWIGTVCIEAPLAAETMEANGGA